MSTFNVEKEGLQRIIDGLTKDLGEARAKITQYASYHSQNSGINKQEAANVVKSIEPASPQSKSPEKPKYM